MRERERRALVIREKHKRARDNILSRARRGFSLFFPIFFFVQKRIPEGGKDTHFCGGDPPPFSLSFYYARARANVYRLMKKENAAKETNLEKVAVVRIGKAVCKANDMVVLF